jgi:chromosome segregation ATPase|tara:strand:+ start:66 stop:440 length:375 start_codon:yes stop_codon:yes gene_type:complete
MPNKTIREFRKLRTMHKNLESQVTAQKQIISALRKEMNALKLQNRRLTSSRDTHKQRLDKIKSDLSFEKKQSRERKTNLKKTQKELVETVFAYNRKINNRDSKITALEQRLQRFNKAVKLLREI